MLVKLSCSALPASPTSWNEKRVFWLASSARSTSGLRSPTSSASSTPRIKSWSFRSEETSPGSSSWSGSSWRSARRSRRWVHNFCCQCFDENDACDKPEIHDVEVVGSNPALDVHKCTNVSWSTMLIKTKVALANRSCLIAIEPYQPKGSMLFKVLS